MADLTRLHVLYSAILLAIISFARGQSRCYHSAPNGEVVGLLPYNRLYYIQGLGDCLEACEIDEAGGKQSCRSATYDRGSGICSLYGTAASSDPQGSTVLSQNVDYYELKERCFYPNVLNTRHPGGRSLASQGGTPRGRGGKGKGKGKGNKGGNGDRDSVSTKAPGKATRTPKTTTTRKPTTTRRTTKPTKLTTIKPPPEECKPKEQEFYASTPDKDSDSLDPEKKIKSVSDVTACTKLCGQNKDNKGKKLAFKCSSGSYNTADKACTLYGSKPKKASSLSEKKGVTFFEKMCLDASDCANKKKPAKGKIITRLTDTRLSSSAIKDEFVDTVEECLDACKANSKCKSAALIRLPKISFCEINKATIKEFPTREDEFEDAVYMDNPCNPE